MSIKIPSIIIVAILVFPIIVAGNDDDWLSKHAVIRTTETQDCDDDGSIKAVRTVKTTSINILQTCTEVKRKDETGRLVLASRTTETIDTFGGKATIVEGLVKGCAGLVVISITSIQRTTEGVITTVQSRNASGAMQIVNRITVATNPDGSITTTVEALDKHGRLVPKQTTTQT